MLLATNRRIPRLTSSTHDSISAVTHWISRLPETSAHRKSLSGCAVFLLALSACGEGPRIPSAATATGSQSLTATVASGTGAFPTVRITDSRGRGIKNVLVRWQVTSGGGRVANDSVRTTPSGEASSGGWILGTTAGVQTLQASAEGVPPVVFTANATPGPIASLERASIDIQNGEVNTTVSAPPSVKAADAYGNPIPGIPVQFAIIMGGGALTGEQQSTNASGIATVSSWKLGTGAGQQLVTASATGVSSIAFAANALAGPPKSLVKVAGDGQQAVANAAVLVRPAVRAIDEFGNAVGNVPVTFTPGSGSGTATGATVTTDLGTGMAVVGGWTLGADSIQTIVATSSALPGVSQTFTVSAVNSLFNIDVRFVGSGGSTLVRNAFTEAALRWRTIIINHVHNTLINVQEGSCGSWTPAMNEMISDIVIYARITSIDGPGKVLGQAGPCFANSSSRLPAMGIMEFDEDDMPNLIANGSLREVILHEMGHVLGIGTLWSYYRSLLVGRGSDDPYFTGSEGLAQFAAINSATYSGNPVPVENQGGAGTRDSHWRESVLARELMTGYLNRNVVNPLSRLTVGSLKDMGYTVNMASADPYSISAQLRYAFPLIQNDAMFLENDIADIPLFEVGADGKPRLVRGSIKQPD